MNLLQDLSSRQQPSDPLDRVIACLQVCQDVQFWTQFSLAGAFLTSPVIAFLVAVRGQFAMLAQGHTLAQFITAAAILFCISLYLGYYYLGAASNANELFFFEQLRRIHFDPQVFMDWDLSVIDDLEGRAPTWLDKEMREYRHSTQLNGGYSRREELRAFELESLTFQEYRRQCRAALVLPFRPLDSWATLLLLAIVFGCATLALTSIMHMLDNITWLPAPALSLFIAISAALNSFALLNLQNEARDGAFLRALQTYLASYKLIAHDAASEVATGSTAEAPWESEDNSAYDKTGWS